MGDYRKMKRKKRNHFKSKYKGYRKRSLNEFYVKSSVKSIELLT